ncbi:AP-2 complex subunit sigma-1 isoform 2 [Galdieria sulphuraria]|uniref:AP-2 complex subunit sigma-1 isoform 2 n=1 Tax=Galdieria sulphuraria TaxID=130081 RepID=M2W3I1_GALSU|nr:AP-2 complex subunit sigma-1 isoform 2 [Galdieria sulphuraria]EME30266.1 AP-2 complex subunit sigma-1 isoform 2 [Galdieria sulphuraria]|eukprot:XP_005706786.1 AP-2 complex subunit sigma-1 isoform 2 [Galdieria sulphuraria]
MIHFILALNIRGQVRLHRFYCFTDSEPDEGVTGKQGELGRIPKPVFRLEGSASKSTASYPLVVRLAPSVNAEMTKSNSSDDFKKKKVVERTKSWNLSHATSGSALIDWTSDSSETLSHSVPTSKVLAKNGEKKQLSEDSVDLIGLWASDQEQGNNTHRSRSSINNTDSNQSKNNHRELERSTKESLKKHFISYRLSADVEDKSPLTPAKKAFIDQVYAQVVSKDYQNSPNFMSFQKYKVVFRRYANLYFILGVDRDDDEFAMLEWIHLWMEVSNESFYNIVVGVKSMSLYIGLG